jgi:hypothetical protein
MGVLRYRYELLWRDRRYAYYERLL